MKKDLTINGARKGTITVYSDSSCKNRINTVPIAETTTYKCTNCVPVEVKIDNHLGLNWTKGSKIHNSIIMTVFNNKKYYYRWREYTNGSNNKISSCQAILSGKEIFKDLEINATYKQGTVTVYSDSSCNNRVSNVPIASTNRYNCTNCNVSNSGGSGSGKGGSSSGTGSNRQKNNSKKCYNCRAYGDGWRQVGTGKKSYCQSVHNITCKDPDGLYIDAKYQKGATEYNDTGYFTYIDKNGNATCAFASPYDNSCFKIDSVLTASKLKEYKINNNNKYCKTGYWYGLGYKCSSSRYKCYRDYSKTKYVKSSEPLKKPILYNSDCD